MEKTLRQEASDCLKIVLFGPESTGKSTLAEALASQYNTQFVPEYMRSYLQQKWDETKQVCTREDLLPIARGQMKMENKMAAQASTYLFCDTSLDELVVYSRFYYDGFCPEELVAAAKENSYDLYFLTYIDVPWEKDDLRDRPNDRLALFSIFEDYLKNNKLPFVILKGSIDERIHIAKNALKNLQTGANT